MDTDPLSSCVNLVATMKGTHGKICEPPKEFSLKWAPNAYEPPPSASTIISCKKPRFISDSKKNYVLKTKGRNKEKGCKFSKGGQSGKDKRRWKKMSNHDGNDQIGLS